MSEDEAINADTRFIRRSMYLSYFMRRRCIRLGMHLLVFGTSGFLGSAMTLSRMANSESTFLMTLLRMLL